MTYNEDAPLATLDDQELALRIDELEHDVLASVRSDNWNIEEQSNPHVRTDA